MDAPPVRFTTMPDGTSIAFTVAGEGPPLLFIDFPTHQQLWWDHPGPRAAFDAMSAHHTLIFLDLPGSGLSGSETGHLSYERIAASMDAVIAATGHRGVSLVAAQHGCPIGLRYAADSTRAVDRLGLWCPYVSGPEWFGRPIIQGLGATQSADWALGTEAIMAVSTQETPSMTLAIKRENFLRYMAFLQRFDVSDSVAAVTTKTLVLARDDSKLVPPEMSRRVAAALPNGEFRSVPGSGIMLWDEPSAVDLMLDFLAPASESASATESGPLRTILFTDVVASTPLLAQLKDEKMRAIMRDHDAVLQAAVDEHDGRVVKTIGDAFMADFAAPSAAGDCAVAMQRGIRDRFMGSDVPIRLRIGINAGEPIAEDDDLHGASVVIAKRLESAAPVDGILVSEGVRQLLAGKDFAFADLGEISLKGFDEPVRAWSVEWDV